MARILVTDGEQRAALALVRSLGRASHQVFVCSARRTSLAGASRHCLGQAQVPDPLTESAAFLSGVAELVTQWQIEVLLPVSEPSLLAILPNRSRFPGTRIPFADHERFVRISDKSEVMEGAAAVGIAVPRQVVLGTAEDAVGLEHRVHFPLVLKPTRSVVQSGKLRSRSVVAHVNEPQMLASALDSLPAGAYPVLVQERIIGPGVGVFLLIEAGELKAAFAHRRIREKPPSGGVSVLRESAPLDPLLLEKSLQLLRRFDWEGVAMVEFKVAESTGTPYIMEINGRFWGSLQLAIDAGVDFPRLLVEADPTAKAIENYRLGVRSRWEWGDVDHLLARLRRSASELALPPGYPGRLKAVGHFLAAFGPANRNEILRAGDPLPFVRESIDWLKRR